MQPFMTQFGDSYNFGFNVGKEDSYSFKANLSAVIRVYSKSYQQGFYDGIVIFKQKQLLNLIQKK